MCVCLCVYVYACVWGCGTPAPKADPPLVNRMKNAWKNINFPHTSYAAGKND